MLGSNIAFAESHPFSPLGPFAAYDAGEGDYDEDGVQLTSDLTEWQGSRSDTWDNDANWTYGFGSGSVSLIDSFALISEDSSATVSSNLYSLVLGHRELGFLELAAGRELDTYFMNIGAASNGYFLQTGGTNIVGKSSGNGYITLGWSADSEGKYHLQNGTTTTDNTVVGYGGEGSFVQFGGEHNVNANLGLAVESGSIGSYTLKSGNLDVAGSSYIGVAGNGSFDQTGGLHSIKENLYIGHSNGSSGSYTLSGGELAISGDIINGTGSSEFNIDGGTLSMELGSSIDVDTFRIGYQSGTTGSYSLLPTHSLSVTNQIIGDSGTGSLTIGGGSNTVSETLTLGNEASGQGDINLTTGTLSAQDLIIGNAGTGSVIQSGGSNTIANNISLGLEDSASGSYQLNNGSVSAGLIRVGEHGIGEFTQTGGTINGRVLLGYANNSAGSFQLEGGNLIHSGTQVIGRKGDAEFIQSGGTNTIQSLLIGKYANSNGTYKLTGGVLTVNDIVVAKAGTGNFVQNNNEALEVSALTLGQDSGSTGSYELISGTLNNSGETVIGDAGTGSFAQTTGNHNTNRLVIGNTATSDGSYSIQSGNLDVATETLVADAGKANFVQVAGNHHTNSLVIGNTATGDGSYSIQSGNLDVATNLVIGSYGQGDFEQSGGTVTISGDLLLADHTTESRGSYSMSGGDLTAKYAVIGYDGVGVFNQTGGNVVIGDASAGSLTLGNSDNSSGSGTYNLSGGALDARIIDSDQSEGSFNYNSGTLNVRDGRITVDNFTMGQTFSSNVSYTHESNNFTTDNLVVGRFGIAELIVTGADTGAELITNSTQIGSGRVGNGNIKLQGGAWTNSGDLSMGGTFGGKSLLSLDSDSNVSIHGDTHVSNQGSLAIANSAFSTTNLNLSGSLKLAENSTLDISNQMAVTSTGNIYIVENTVQEISADLVHNGSEIRINEGAELILGGAVSGTGAYTGLGKTTINNSFNPGNSPGLVTFEGDLALGENSHTIMEVTGLILGDEYDAVQVGGTLSLNGLLDIDLSSFEPTADYSFDLFSAETINGYFSDVNFLTGGLNLARSPWSLDYIFDVDGLDYLRLDYNKVGLGAFPGNPTPTSPVPEPSVLALMSFGLLMLLGVNRRKFKLDSLES